MLRKDKTLKLIYKILKSKAVEILYVAILFTVLFTLDIAYYKKVDYHKYFKFEIATSLSITYFFAILISLILKRIERSIEDSMKLNNDYDSLITMYSNDYNKIVVHKKESIVTPCEFDDWVKNSSNSIAYPVTIEYRFNEPLVDIIIYDEPAKKYSLPTIIEHNMTQLFQAHKHSIVFNATNIRLDDLWYQDNKLYLATSRTTYFDSLVTNRAMDVDFSHGLSVRKLFEFNSSISSLKESRLSNHIGINGIVETNDEKFLFVKRYHNVSIGKNTLGCSIGASLKTQFALNESGLFTSHGLRNAIVNEIKNELFLDADADFDILRNVIGVYRDFVEGGKPQILFYYKSSKNEKDIHDTFLSALKAKKGPRNLMLNDGKDLIFLEPEKISLETDCIVSTHLNGNTKKFSALPTTTASIALVLQHKYGQTKGISYP